MATAMNLKMSFAAGDMDHAGSGDCMACRSDSDSASTLDCPPACNLLNSGAVLSPVVAVLYDRAAGFTVFGQTEPTGAFIVSDPYPPKPSIDS